MADAMHPEPFGDYDLDEHPFDALGGYDQARRVFGGAETLGELIAGFNAQCPEGRRRNGTARTDALVLVGARAERRAAGQMGAEEVFPFHAELARNGATDFMDGARLVIDEPTVLTQRTWAPTSNTFSRMVPHCARASCVPARPARRSVCIST